MGSIPGQGTKILHGVQCGKKKKKKKNQNFLRLNQFGTGLLKHGYIRHITVNGDRLNKLAEKYLHDESRWEEIFRANRNQLTNQAVVPIGIVLIIPAK